MKTLQIRVHVDEDGKLTVTMPPEVAGQELDLVMVFEQRGAGSPAEWPPGLFERTAGAWQGEPLAREPEGQFECRDRLG